MATKMGSRGRRKRQAFTWLSPKGIGPTLVGDTEPGTYILVEFVDAKGLDEETKWPELLLTQGGELA